MPGPSRSPAAGGALIAIAILVGTALGLTRGEPSLGFLIGLALGVALAVAIWLRGRG